MPKPPPKSRINLRKLIEIVLAVAVLELGFFLFRLGARWWSP